MYFPLSVIIMQSCLFNLNEKVFDFDRGVHGRHMQGIKALRILKPSPNENVINIQSEQRWV